RPAALGDRPGPDRRVGPCPVDVEGGVEDPHLLAAADVHGAERVAHLVEVADVDASERGDAVDGAVRAGAQAGVAEQLSEAGEPDDEVALGGPEIRRAGHAAGRGSRCGRTPGPPGT